MLRAHDIDARVRYCVSDFSTQLLLAAAELAVALVPRLARNPLPPGVRFIPCDPPVTRSIAVPTTNSTDTPALRACLHELHAVLDAMPRRLSPGELSVGRRAERKALRTWPRSVAVKR